MKTAAKAEPEKENRLSNPGSLFLLPSGSIQGFP